MPKDNRRQILPGTLEMLVLQTLRVDHGSLGPALQRLERTGLITSERGASDDNRPARYYKLTRARRKKLADQTGKSEQIVRAVKGVLQARSGEEHA